MLLVGAVGDKEEEKEKIEKDDKQAAADIAAVPKKQKLGKIETSALPVAAA